MSPGCLELRCPRREVVTSPYVSQDLAYKWVQLFQDQATRQQFWQDQTMADFVLSVREQVGALAETIPAARAGLAMWIQWFGPATH